MLVKLFEKDCHRWAMVLRRDLIAVPTSLKGFGRSVLCLLWVVLENNTSINERKLRRGSFSLRGRESFHREVKNGVDFLVIPSAPSYCVNYRDHLSKISQGHTDFM